MPLRTATRTSLSVAASPFGLGEHVVGERLRYHDHAVVVSHDPVARLDLDAADRHRDLCRLELPAPRRVLRRYEPAEDREALSADEADVATAAVEHAAGDSTCRERRDGELAKVGRDVVVAGIHGDVARRHVSQHCQHLADRRVVGRRVGARGPPAPDRVRRSCEAAAAVERSDRRRERLRVEPACVEDVREGSRVDRREALPHGSGIPRSGGRSSPRPSTSSGACSSSSRRTSSARRTRSRPSFTASSSRWRPDG